MTSDPADWARRPGQGAYARSEIERRFLVRHLPTLSDPRLIEDRYLDGLRLRLRRVSADGHVVCKLTQKVRRDEADPSHLAITNTYLDEDEYHRLLALPGADLRKTRAVVGPMVVDVFHERWQGLVLAESEVAALTADLLLPTWLGAEVTADDRFSGGRLARAGDLEATALLEMSRTARGVGARS